MPGAGTANLVLPFRGNQFSFSLNTRTSADEALLADLSAVVFDRQGQVLDVVHPHKPSALHGAVCTSRDPSHWPETCQAVPGDDVVHVLPKLLEPSAEVVILVASVPVDPGVAQDLLSLDKLELVVTHAGVEDNSALTERVVRDLLPIATKLGGVGRSQSILLAVAVLDQPGWTVRFDHAGSAQPSWSLMVQELQAAIVRVKTECGIALDAANALQAKPPSDTTIVGFSRLYEDRSLDEAVQFRLPEAGPVSKLRLDVAWKFWGKTPEDELEGVAVEFAIKFYDANVGTAAMQGEEVQTAGTNDREAAGVAVGRPEPEDAGEAEEPAEPPPEEEEGGEGGEEGEEGAAKEKPPPPPEPAEDPFQFKQRDVAFITLAELPKEVRCFVVLITNTAGSGFKELRHAGVKLLDVSGGEDSARPVAEWHHYSPFEQEASITQLALLKIYKEYHDSAWNLWREARSRSIEEFVGRDPEQLLTVMKAAQQKHKEFKALEAKAAADAEESGEEVTVELRKSSWRYRVLGMTMGGDNAEATEADIKNIITYDGPLKSQTTRTCSCARVQFSGEKPDTYFGGYQDDLKSGPGLYCFATGAIYIGQYKGGKREGKGVMLLPDGGQYIGEFAADRFHGQGQYRYPDGSVYTGSWGTGTKHGPGVYWDTAKGCLRGNWVKGVLQGTASYDQPTTQFTGEFVAGVPAGPCKFTIAAHRTLDMPTFAAAHILDNGPTLRGGGEYAIPPGSGDPPKLDEEGNPIEDPDKPPLPTFPKYEGLAFKSTLLPISVTDVNFPPLEGLPVPIKDVPLFSVAAGGLVPPT